MVSDYLFWVTGKNFGSIHCHFYHHCHFHQDALLNTWDWLRSHFSTSDQIKQTTTFPDTKFSLSAHHEVSNLLLRGMNCTFHWASLKLLKEEDNGKVNLYKTNYFIVSSWPLIEPKNSAHIRMSQNKVGVEGMLVVQIFLIGKVLITAI